MDSDIRDPVNIGNPDERSILELAELIIELCNSDSESAHEALPPQDPDIRYPDITKAKTELSWEPEIQLREGLKQTIEAFEPRV